VIKHLKENGFEITLLTRNLSKTKEAFPSLPAVEADYDSLEALTKALTEDVGAQDAVVSLINREELQAQINLIDAAIAAKIPHLVPSSFGLGTRESWSHELPILKAKTEMEDYVVAKARAGEITYTGIQTGAFLDWALERVS
jgi:uncharacterized protein YbjT (DUF2867 family)